MGAVAFDTLEFFETLKHAGVPEGQARAFSTVICKSHDAAEHATKTDVQGVETALRHDMEKMDASLRHEINDLRKDMDARFDKVDAKFDKISVQLTVRLGIMISALVTVLPYIVKTLHLSIL